LKRLAALMLSALMIMTLLPHLAFAKDTLDVTPVKEFRFSSPTSLEDVFTVQNTSGRDVIVTVVVQDQATQQTVQTMNFPLLMGSAPVAVQAYVYRPLSHHEEINTYRYTITTDGGYSRRLYYGQKLTITTDANGNPIHIYDQMDNSYYPRNTVSSMGPHFREVTPNLTKLWYMFTPIDLSIQGRQSFPLVASNIFEVGQVHVDVNMDTVVVTYEMCFEDKPNYTTERLSDFLTFYNAYTDISIVEPEEMPGPSHYAFGQPFSILNHLGGDTNVIMFVRNRITYYEFPAPKSAYIRYWRNKPEYKSRIEGMLQMMDPIMTVDEAAK
jgi:hypothetical protein